VNRSVRLGEIFSPLVGSIGAQDVRLTSWKRFFCKFFGNAEQLGPTGID